MKNNALKNFGETVDKNLPTILTGISMTSSIVTVVYAIYAGYKLKDEIENISSEAELIEYLKVIAPRLIPVILGTTVTAGCAFAANRENGKRYAAVAAGLAATQVDKDALQQKMNVLLGKADEETVKEVKDMPVAQSSTKNDPFEKHWFHDTETGYMFQTTLSHFWEEVYSFNDALGNMDKYDCSDINEFYSGLLGNDYSHASVHDDVRFGPACNVKTLSPKLEGEVAQNMELVYKVSYRYSTDGGYDDSI